MCELFSFFGCVFEKKHKSIILCRYMYTFVQWLEELEVVMWKKA
jgi:hypothetical protein